MKNEISSHDLAKKLLNGPNLPVELWVQDSPYSANSGMCRDIELSENKTTIQLATWSKTEL